MTRSIEVKISFVQHLLSTAEGCHLGHSTIDGLSDDVLLCVFNSYRQDSESCLGMWPWGDLVHVCRRWRRIVFAFPRYLDLRLRCRSKTDAQATLDIWPRLPLGIYASLDDESDDEDDIIGTLEHRDRINRIHLREFNHSQLKKCIALMQEPFPVLKSLELLTGYTTVLVTASDAFKFLGGSAPLLQRISLHGILFPSVPRFLSSASDLVHLSLCCIPLAGEGHLSPNVMTTCLSVSTKLRSLNLTLLPQRSSPYPTDQHPPPSTHTVLPSLVNLRLEGPHGYLDDLVGRVDAPLLESGYLEFHSEPTFDTPRVPRFIHATKMFKLLDKFEVSFYKGSTNASFHSSISPARFSLSFECSMLPAQVTIMERICAQWPPLVSLVEIFQLDNLFYEEEKWWETVAPWLGFLRPFTAVQTLRLYGIDPVSHVTHMLGGLKGERATKVLPALRTIELHCLEPGGSESLRLLEPFLVAREESEHPVAVDVGIRV